MKPGRYVVIGRLYVPIVDDVTHEDTSTFGYHVGEYARAKRIALCRADPHPRRLTKFQRIWQQILKARKEQ